MTKKKSSLAKALQAAQQLRNKTNQINKRLDETKNRTKKLVNKKTPSKTHTNQQPPTGKNETRITDEKINPLIRTDKTQSRSLSMADKGDKILLIGEGNFSFAVTLIIHHLHPGKLITASTLDSKEAVLEKYPDASGFLKILEENQVTILFELDGCKLSEDKRIKKIIKDDKFDKVIFNFPHVGGSEPDQDRSIRANQILILRFLRSVSTLLFQPNQDHQSLITVTRKRRKSSHSQNKHPKKHLTNSFESSDSGSDYPLEPDDDSDLELNPLHHLQSRKPGTVLITTGTSSPYSLWDVPKLAKNGRVLAHSILYPSYPNLKLKGDQPNYKVVRSFDFDQFITKNNNHKNINDHSESGNESITYQHRQTNGFKNANKDSKPCFPRTWEFQLLP